MNVGAICLHCMQAVKDTNGICIDCKKTDAEIDSKSRYLPLRTIVRGKYLIGKVIGEGGFGITYIAFDLDLEVRVAIKEYFPRDYVGRDSMDGTTLIPFDAETGEVYQEEMSKFIGEAKRLAKFRGLKGIVPILDYFMENGTAYIVMEYIDGFTLKEFLKENGKPMPVSRILSLMEPVINALEQVHQVGMIHRDISPDNIMMTKEGKEIYLIDFGTARIVNQAEEYSLSVYKKRSYTPPEQQSRHGNQGPWTDVYALCATIYYCITGKMIPEAMERLMKDEVVVPSDMDIVIEKQIEEALLKGLSLQVDERFLSMEELREALYLSKKDEVKETESVEKRKAAETDEQVDTEVVTISKVNTSSNDIIREKEKSKEQEWEIYNYEVMQKKRRKRRFWVWSIAVVLFGILSVLVSFSKCKEVFVDTNYVSDIGVTYASVRVEQEYSLAFWGINRELLCETIYFGTQKLEEREFQENKIICTYADGTGGIYERDGYWSYGCYFTQKSLDDQVLVYKEWSDGWHKAFTDSRRTAELFDEVYFEWKETYEYHGSKLTKKVVYEADGQRTEYSYNGESETEETYSADGFLIERYVTVSGECQEHAVYENDEQGRVIKYTDELTGKSVEYEYTSPFDWNIDYVDVREYENGELISILVTLNGITEEPIILAYIDDVLTVMEGDEEAFLEYEKNGIADLWISAYEQEGLQTLKHTEFADSLAKAELNNNIGTIRKEELVTGIYEKDGVSYKWHRSQQRPRFVFVYEEDPMKIPGYTEHDSIGVAIALRDDGWYVMVAYLQE